MEAVLEGVREYIASAPRAGEAGRTIGPILAGLLAASRPVAAPPNGSQRPTGNGLAGAVLEGVAAGGTAPLLAAGERAGAHALVYLARHRFACPGLEAYDFAASTPGGVHSPRLDRAIDSLGAAEARGGMRWDADGRFAGLVRKHGDDAEWLSIAALLCMMEDAARTRGDAPSRRDMIDEACMECGALARGRMGGVYDDLCRMGLLGQGLPGPRA